MAQRGNRPSQLQELLTRRRLGAQVRPKCFERHRLQRRRILDEIARADRALSKAPHQCVGADCVPEVGFCGLSRIDAAFAYSDNVGVNRVNLRQL